MTLRDACLWRAGVVDELPEHQHHLVTLLDIASGYTISPTTSTLVPVPWRQGVFQRSNMIYTTQIARLDGELLSLTDYLRDACANFPRPCPCCIHR